ncbi:MAG: hypothetical protein IKF16_01575 [Lachnospiraceae bacterium]|nr:hypothetical protein [Lachnospiraceae bacterium]
MPRKKKTPDPAEPVTSVTPVTAETSPVTRSREKKVYRCMDCGREIYTWINEKVYTVKYRKGGIAIACSVCAMKKKVRLRALGITYDAKRFLYLGEEGR